jgi:hypothetical protein
MTTTYYLRSSVLGGAIVEELNSSGQKLLGYVYTPAGSLLARQAPGTDYVSLKQISPIGASQYEFNFSTTMTESVSRREFDPAGANVPLNNHSSLGHGGAAGDIPGGGGGASDSRFGALENPAAGCVLDGSYTPCDWIGRMSESGSLALAITSQGKTTKLDLRDFGLGLRGLWIDDGTPLHMPHDDPNDDVVRVYRDELNGHWELASFNLGSSVPPQDIAHGRSAEFIKCANDAGLGYLLTDDAWKNGHRFNDENAKFINRLSYMTGVDAGLLGFTFDHEGSFDQQAGPNMNGQDDPHNADWGPFQLNYNQTMADINSGAYNLDYLDIHGVFGDFGNTSLNPVQNGILAGRKLKYLLKASKNDYAKAAGRYRSWKGSDFTTRRDQWKQEGKAFQSFFKCFTQYN